ncbi:MAG: DUF2203 domain-containing protein [Planctomycetota bacterium]
MPAARPEPPESPESPESPASAPSAEISFETVGRKRFTRDQADRSLAYVEPVVRDVQEQYGKILELRQSMNASTIDLVALDEGPESSERSDEVAYEAAMDRLGELVDELHAVGVELRDFERGMIAFPCDHKDRTLLLSWQPGEPGVGFFHEQDESVAERRPLSSLA